MFGVLGVHWGEGQDSVQATQIYTPTLTNQFFIEVTVVILKHDWVP